MFGVFGLAVSIASQVPRGEEYIDCEEKRAAIAAIEKVAAENPRVHWLCTPRAIVVYDLLSKQESDLEDAARDARERAMEQIDLHFDICERILPPHDKCAVRFAILDPEGLMRSVWPPPEEGSVEDRTQPEESSGGRRQFPTYIEFAYAQQARVVGWIPFHQVWAIYEKAWFGSVVPAEWFTALCAGRLWVEFQAARDEQNKKEKKPRPFLRQNARDWAKIPKGKIAESLDKIGAKIDESRYHGALHPQSEERLIAMFLAYGKEEPKPNFPEAWALMLPTYAQALLEGKKEEEASKLAVGDLDRKSMQEAILKWAKQKAK